MKQTKNIRYFVLALSLLARPSLASVTIIEDKGSAKVDYAFQAGAWKKFRAENGPTPVSGPCSLSPEAIETGKERLESLRYRLSVLSQLDDSLSSPGGTKEQIESIKQARADAKEEARKTADAASAEQLCLFRGELRAFIQSAVKNEKNLELARELEKVGNCLAQEPDGALALRNRFHRLFRGIFDHFMGKDELTDEDCALLRSTYSLWSSGYEAENAASQASGKAIPAYNVNNHNASFYYWAEEQRRGHIPTSGLTIFHADTHTDMGHVHTHYSPNWLGNVADLQETQSLLSQPGDRLRAGLKKMIRTSKRVPADSRDALLDILENMPEERLRSELEENMRKTVHHIAQPLAAAQYTGTSNGRFVMCMPPWSSELPRSQPAKNPGAAAKMQPLAMKFMKIKTSNQVGFLIDCKDQPPGGWNLTCDDLSKSSVSQIGESQFQVLDCNREERKQVGQDSGGNPIYTYSRTKTAFPYKDFFQSDDRQNGFLLDIDLDVFVSEGNGKIVEPISYERTIRHQKSLGKHSGHGMNSETDPYVQVSTKELGLIRERMGEFFQSLADAKKDGYVPKVVTIADSSALVRAVMPKKIGEDANGAIKAFTPECLAFLVNYMTRTRLKQIYPEISFQP